MKKLLLLLISIIFLTACSNNNINDITKNFSDDVNNADSYELVGKMSIVGDEEEFNYSINVKYLKDNNYKVELLNVDNNHKQIILKNEEGVYVITPELNRSYKFESSWPNNSSQSYILGSLLKDINNDAKNTLKQKNNEYIITTSVNYPNNEELVKENIYFDSKMKLKKVIVFDSSNKERIITEFSKYDLNANINKDEFKLDNYIKEINDELKNTKSECKEGNCSKTTSNILDDIIYPLYLPGNTFLTSSESIGSEDNKRVILTFKGDKDFTIIEEVASIPNEFEINPVYGDPVLLNDTLGVMQDNSVRWTRGNVSYYLTSNTLSSSEMSSIASSMNQTKSVAGSK